jgi:Family of unknown function (DUF6644)
LESLLNWIYDLGISATIRESSFAFPILECIHLYSMVFLIGIVSAFDLRLMGVSIEDQPLSHYSKLVRRWVWLPLSVNTVTGTLLFMSKPTEYSANMAFVVKMMFLFLGVAYHAIIVRRSARWNNLATMPAGVSVLGGISLVFWLGILASSRWIAYVI